MTLLSMTDDQGNNVEHWDYGQYRNNNISTYRYGLRDVIGATNKPDKFTLEGFDFVFNVSRSAQLTGR